MAIVRPPPGQSVGAVVDGALADHVQTLVREAGLLHDIAHVLKSLQSVYAKGHVEPRTAAEQRLIRNALFALVDLVKGNEKSQKLAGAQRCIPIVVGFLTIRSTSMSSQASAATTFADRAASSFSSNQSSNQWYCAAYALRALVSQNSRNQKDLKESGGFLHLLNAISSAKTVLVSVEFAEGHYEGSHSVRGLNELLEECLKTLLEVCGALESSLSEVIGPALIEVAKSVLNCSKGVTEEVKESLLRLLLLAVRRKERWRDLISSELGEAVGVLYADTKVEAVAKVARTLILAFAGSAVEQL